MVALFLSFCCAVILPSCGEKSNPFPVWEEAIVEPTVSDIFMDFRGITILDECALIELTVHNNTSDYICYSWGGGKIEYCYDDIWYTVYHQEAIGPFIQETFSPGDSLLEVSIPKNVLVKSGLYRVYIPFVQYCEFEFVLIE